MSPAVEQRLTQLWESPHTLWGELTTVDHQKLGKRYLATAFAFLIMGGLEALVMRLQLAGPNRSMVDPETYDQLFTMQRQGDIFAGGIPLKKGDRVVGAIGVSGGTGKQDQTVAEAGAAAF